MKGPSMRPIRTAVMLGVVFLALAVFASQNASSPSAQNPPSPAPQALSAGSPDTGQQAPPPQSPGAAGHQGMQQQGTPSLEDQVNALTQLLNLTADQQTKARTILQDQHQQAMAVVGDNTTTRDQKMQKITALREATIGKMRGILTDEQKPKFDEMVKQQNDRLRQREQQEQPNPSSPK